MPIDFTYLVTQSITLVFLVLIQYGNGLLVEYRDVKVNYTRKINHFALFFLPILLNRSYAYDQQYGLFILAAVLAVLKFGFYTEPVRERVPFIKMMFRSFDRPEDRPHTLFWIATQTAAGHAVLISMGILFARNGYLNLILIPILIYGIGDGLAEPVGVRFGRHKYQAWALFSRQKYHRTLEGSLCVLVTGLVVIAAHFNYFPETGHFLAAMAVVPLLMTLAEAFSPHTWDSPFMFLTGYAALFVILRF